MPPQTNTSDLSKLDKVERVTAWMQQDSTAPLGDLLDQMHPSQIADALEVQPKSRRLDLWQQVATAVKGEVLVQVHRDVGEQLIAATPESELLAALDTLQVDELADLDAQLPLAVLAAMVGNMDLERRASYEAVSAYPDDSAGGLMDIDAIAVRENVRLTAVLRYLRQLRAQRGTLPEHLDSLTVISRDGDYRGILRLSDLLSLDPEMEVGEVMCRTIPAISVAASASSVRQLFEDQDLISAPVVGETGALLGRITIDDVVDVLREETERDLMGRAGLSTGVDLFGPLHKSAAQRVTWLAVNLVNALVAASVIGLFEASIEQVVALAVLMPVVASMGGVAGSQTLTLVIRGIALAQIRRSNAVALLLRELALGLLSGIFWALVAATIAYVWFGSLALAGVFGAALVINLLVGAAAGTLVPLGLHRAGIDPALAGGVLLIAATDIVGFAAFLGLATLLLL